MVKYLVAKLHDKEYFVHSLAHDDLVQTNDVLVLNPLQGLDLADGGDGEALLLEVHAHLLQRHLNRLRLEARDLALSKSLNQKL